MSLDHTGSRSRRAVLGAAIGGVAGTMAAALAQPLAVAAADGDPLILGQENSAASLTELAGRLTVVSNDRAAVTAISATLAVEGQSDTGTGVYGASDGAAGWSTSGVHGHATRLGGNAVSATHANEGTALFVHGKVALETRSGRVTIAASRTTVDIDLRAKGGLTGTPLLFANLMSHRPGVHVAAVRANYPVAGKARIYLTRAPASPTHVAWLVLN